MKKNVWIWNHYATNMFFEQGGRHYWIAEHLIKQGYKPVIFCASTIHNTSNIVDTGSKRWVSKDIQGISFVFIKTMPYSGNGLGRIRNMLLFYRNLLRNWRDYAKENGYPEIILASSVHPLTLLAGIKVAKKLRIECICEIRDLWPETLVEYGALKRTGLLARLLYRGEKHIYTKADKLIFTMEGASNYILQKRWDTRSGGSINIEKISHINNGVNIEQFDYNKDNYKLFDEDLNNSNTFKIVYAGSIREANALDQLLLVAEKLMGMGHKDIQFIIFGQGNALELLEKQAISAGINNILFKGKVDKKYIPYITSQAQVNVIFGKDNNIFNYGISMNKLFEYLASGKPVLTNFKLGYSFEQELPFAFESGRSIQEIADTIISIKNLSRDQYRIYCHNARGVAEKYDFKNLTDKLIGIIEDDSVKRSA